MTAWQLRDDADGQVLNDHADADYDAAVLDRLAAVHDDTIAWLGPLEAGCARLADYGARLGRAFEQARAGDQRYVASPRVDSYHGIWFELHEDLIQLGRPRRRGARSKQERRVKAMLSSRDSPGRDQRPLAYPRAVDLSQREPALLFWM